MIVLFSISYIDSSTSTVTGTGKTKCMLKVLSIIIAITNTLSGSLFPFVITVGMVPGCFHAASYSVTLFALFTPWD